MTDYTVVSDDETIAKTKSALEQNGFSVRVADTLDDAKNLVSELIPKGSQVFTAASKTLEAAGIITLINESGDYDAVKPKMMEMAKNEPENVKGRKQLTATPDYIIGSASALSEEGYIMVASATGSQLGPEVYGAGRVVFVIGANKIVEHLNDGVQRIKEHIFPQEQERIREHYGNPDVKTYFSKMLVYFEDYDRRVDVIIVKEKAGF